jgi:hypothetical protein
MERFCGSTQRRVKNRRFPWANIDRHLISSAHLSHIKIKFDVTDELRMGPSKSEVGAHAVAIDGCECFDLPLVLSVDSLMPFILLLSDPTCVLLPPVGKRQVERGMLDKIVAALRTRFNVSLANARKIITPARIREYGKVQRLEGGDTMYAASLVRTAGEDRRDATYVRVRLTRYHISLTSTLLPLPRLHSV